MGKQDHRVGAERVLRPGVMLRVLAGAGNGREGVAADGRLGNAWRARGRAAGEGNRAGAEGERRVEFILAGGGAAAAAERRPEAKHCRRQEAEQRSTCSRKKKKGEGFRGTCLEISEILVTSR
jgi:hypothetical protein